jgi:hypothetical protein
VEHQFSFVSKTSSSVAVSWLSEVAAAKADARQEKLLKLLAEEVANEPPSRKN